MAEGLEIEGTVALITALVALVGVLVSVFTLANSARKDAFAQLQTVVQELKGQLETATHRVTDLEKLLEEARRENERLEDERDHLKERIDAQDALIGALQAEINKLKGNRA